jgi:hypothetical protein
MSESIDETLMQPGRKIIVADSEIDLTAINAADIFILFIEESIGSAGGRAGGLGFRKIRKITRFSCANGRCVKSFETESAEAIELFDIPYSAVAMDITLSQGQQTVIQGVVDPSLVRSYINYSKNTK